MWNLVVWHTGACVELGISSSCSWVELGISAYHHFCWIGYSSIPNLWIAQNNLKHKFRFSQFDSCTCICVQVCTAATSHCSVRTTASLPWWMGSVPVCVPQAWTRGLAAPPPWGRVGSWVRASVSLSLSFTNDLALVCVRVASFNLPSRFHCQCRLKVSLTGLLPRA